MICYSDKTYCVSPNCNNECGKKLTEEIEKAAIEGHMYLSCGYFCGPPELEE